MVLPPLEYNFDIEQGNLFTNVTTTSGNSAASSSEAPLLSASSNSKRSSKSKRVRNRRATSRIDVHCTIPELEDCEQHGTSFNEHPLQSFSSSNGNSTGVPTLTRAVDSPNYYTPNVNISSQASQVNEEIRSNLFFAVHSTISRNARNNSNNAISDEDLVSQISEADFNHLDDEIIKTTGTDAFMTIPEKPGFRGATGNDKQDNAHYNIQLQNECDDDKDSLCTASSSISGGTIDSRIVNQIAEELNKDELVIQNKNTLINHYNQIYYQIHGHTPDLHVLDQNDTDFNNYLREFKRNNKIELSVKKRLREKQYNLEDNAVSLISDINGRYYFNDNETSQEYLPQTNRIVSANIDDYSGRNNNESGKSDLDFDPNENNPGNNPHGNFDNSHVQDRLQRKLTLRHLQMIALSGTLGVGLYLSTSKNFSVSGPMGAVLGYTISGSLVLVTMLCLSEMVSFIPLVGGISGIGSRFVDDAFGFASGFIYWINYTISLPSEITAGTIMLSYYDDVDLPGKSAAGWITLFLVWSIGVNLVGVRAYGETEFFLSILKILIVLLSIVLNIVINTGGMPPLRENIGFTFWKSQDSISSPEITYGLFRPTFDISDTGTGSTRGIGGNTGRFLSILASTCIATYAYVGSDIVVIAAGEAKSPRRTLPSAANRVFWRILIFYIISVFCVSLNVYSGDPRLIHYRSITTEYSSSQQARDTEVEVVKYFGGDSAVSQYLRNPGKAGGYEGFYNGNQSPWVIAFQNARVYALASLFNGIFVVFALSAGSSQLYASSRTLYHMALQSKAPKIFATCSKNGIPYVAILFSSMFGCLAYLCIGRESNMIFQRLTLLCAASGQIVWGSMCLSFIRFYYGLKLRTDLVGVTHNRFYGNYFKKIAKFLKYRKLQLFLTKIWLSIIRTFYFPKKISKNKKNRDFLSDSVNSVVRDTNLVSSLNEANNYTNELDNSSSSSYSSEKSDEYFVSKTIYPYKVPLQPLLAYYGLFLAIFLNLATGFSVFLKGCWNTVDFITSYACLVLFVVLYFGYKIIMNTKILRLDQIQLDVGRKEHDAAFWKQSRAYDDTVKGKIKKGLRYFI